MHAALTLAKTARAVALVAGVFLLAACASTGSPTSGGASRAELPVVTDPAPIVPGTMRPYQVRGRWYRPEEQPNYDQVGMASWYGDRFNGRPTSTGERFDMHALTAAHKTLPLPGLVEVTNLANGRTVVLRVNDRGPFVDDRIIDLSRGAAEALDMLQQGVAEVRVRYLGRAPRMGGGSVLQYARTDPPQRARSPAPEPSSGRFWIEVAAYPTQPDARATAGRLGAAARVQAATDNSMSGSCWGPGPMPMPPNRRGSRPWRGDSATPCDIGAIKPNRPWPRVPRSPLWIDVARPVHHVRRRGGDRKVHPGRPPGRSTPRAGPGRHPHARTWRFARSEAIPESGRVRQR